MKNISYLVCVFLLIFGMEVRAEEPDYLELSWKEVARKMPDEWYGSVDAAKVAENVIKYQKDVGGWPKNLAMHQALSRRAKSLIKASAKDYGATIDNEATTLEMRFLARVYALQGGEELRRSFIKGLDYLLEAQYDNGGWPQFYPVRNQKHYSVHITYNDNAMLNVMNLLKDVYEGKEFAALQLPSNYMEQARASFDKGVEAILATQIVVNGEPTVWCAQHHRETMLPVQARAYELPSFSGSESAGITLLLMDIDKPSDKVIAAVEAAVSWFETNKIEGFRVDWFMDENGEMDRKLVADPDSGPLWARFYDLDNGKPFFCDRDGVKKWSMEEISQERRGGYAWYTEQGAKVLKRYPKWKKTL